MELNYLEQLGLRSEGVQVNAAGNTFIYTTRINLQTHLEEFGYYIRILERIDIVVQVITRTEIFDNIYVGKIPSIEKMKELFKEIDLTFKDKDTNKINEAIMKVKSMRNGTKD